LRLEGKQFWRYEIRSKVFRNICAETYIRKTVECKNKEHPKKIRLYVIEYERTLEKLIRRQATESIINSNV
jgi:hypothetical protein